MAELRKRNMQQEAAIGEWVESLDKKNNELKEAKDKLKEAEKVADEKTE